MDFEKIASKLAAFFQQEKCRYAIVGAFGLHGYGMSRATGDLDFVIDAACQDSVIGFLEESGYETLHRSSGYSNHFHPEEALGRIDFIYVSGRTAETIFNNAAITLKIGDQPFPVPRPEHLAAMKIQAMKNDPSRTFQELADIQFLLSLPDIDHQIIREHFKRHGLLEKYNELQENKNNS